MSDALAHDGFYTLLSLLPMVWLVNQCVCAGAQATAQPQGVAEGLWRL